ncbi:MULTISPECIES: chemotaxis protein CheW [Geobacillus]|jgi:purine-binding chemotaxis protein CheW|uniref:Chemotaxis protein (Modulation of CheA activity inresponse to attractants) n=1 Tax=Geobacillus thermodenitrificans (strain NG80-2) TaxID=420246 RepID=A4IQN5_GEOTN|nr:MULTISPECIES: chemotaxis protein CheW [Geobacillus]ABO67639.1 Chemotaxis protein (modulation of CheA activity inresponse to attractants) [Geobacillus thermodenitrificans NG80-2]ARA99219.1 chemotaxis protein CheW [Geobacillus thermodenitrificans]KQB92668.1 chemotaxis protein CheW [Geobacillus sp. PA-3]MEC5187481.1 purine-binding chemotaxis protein CheW [Geobacillus thermodenitrificans]MED3719098.1 chemotaxis protein CheW [Geobacillus thermodenitrificans]
MDKYVVFRVEREQYVISIAYVVSIEKMTAPTAVPHMPDYMAGVVRIRGELVPVLDMRKLLYGRAIEETDQTRLIVAAVDDLSVAFIVDEAKEIADIGQDAIQPLQLMSAERTPYLVGMATLPDRLLTVLDPRVLFNHLEEAEEIREQVAAVQSDEPV